MALLALMAVPAFAQDDQNCADFGSQAEAQDHLEMDTSDPDNLDTDDDGQACENFDYGTTGGDDDGQTDGDDGTDDQGPGDDQQAGDTQDDQQEPAMPGTGAGGLAPVGGLPLGALSLLAGGLLLAARRIQ